MNLNQVTASIRLWNLKDHDKSTIFLEAPTRSTRLSTRQHFRNLIFYRHLRLINAFWIQKCLILNKEMYLSPSISKLKQMQPIYMESGPVRNMDIFNQDWKFSKTTRYKNSNKKIAKVFESDFITEFLIISKWYLKLSITVLCAYGPKPLYYIWYFILLINSVSIDLFRCMFAYRLNRKK